MILRFAPFALLLSTFVVGCASSAGGTTGDDQNVTAAPSGDQTATLIPKNLDASDRASNCQVGADYYAVQLTNTAAADVISTVLARKLDDFRTNGHCAIGSEPIGYIESAMTVALNAKGLLSISQWIDGQNDGAEPTANDFKTYNFDLKTGSSLALTDVISAQGLDVIARACGTALQPKWGSKAADYCETAIKTTKSFILQDAGLRLNAGPQPVSDDIFEGVLVPWATLKPYVQHPAVKILAGS